MSASDTGGGGPQRDAFLGGEGDRWFARNDSQDIAPYMRSALDSISRFLHPGQHVLEIGCANGRNLAYLAQARAGLNCSGVEPSAAAVTAARQLYPSLRVEQGSADRLPYANGSVDLVFFGFCLYLVDRELVLAVVAEADRVLRDGGFIAIVDFDPVSPRRRAYRHLPGVFSYKMDYSRPFLASAHYSLAHKHSYSHAGSDFHPQPSERVATTVLHKSVAAGYVDESD